MTPVRPQDRQVVNIDTAAFTPWPECDDPNAAGWSYLQLGEEITPGVGFHIYRMAPGATSTAHEHVEDEHFLILDGELIDNDGTVFRKGDLVWFRKGTQHSSHTRDGCVLAVYIAKPERNLA